LFYVGDEVQLLLVRPRDLLDLLVDLGARRGLDLDDPLLEIGLRLDQLFHESAGKELLEQHRRRLLQRSLEIVCDPLDQHPEEGRCRLERGLDDRADDPAGATRGFRLVLAQLLELGPCLLVELGEFDKERAEGPAQPAEHPAPFVPALDLAKILGGLVE
jgi:hypothetical protein